ncbi:putative signal peptide protein [Puccinia sorghi]|uniref:Putative signal peptide protein n=1 Tax=Puccinia sorghi TaxID=27349 RepID=A0A0L6UDG1_9BASI|nr:putative signal peptide protein [Puccinia sorghi]
MKLILLVNTPATLTALKRDSQVWKSNQKLLQRNHLQPKHYLLDQTPQVLKQWWQTAIPEYLAWEEKFTNCFQLTINLKAKAGPNKVKYY